MGKENQIEIRNLTANDVLGVAQIKVDGWRTAYKGIMDDEFLNSLDVETQAQQFAECVGSNNFIVAILNGEVVGFCRFIYDNSLSPNIDYADCELTAIYVRPDLKNQGIGTKMFKEVVKRFKDKNGSIICRELLEGIESSNSPIPSPRTDGYYKKNFKSVIISN